MTEIVLLACIVAKPGEIEAVKNGLSSLIAPTRAEEGCLLYLLQQDHENPAVFLFYERWASAEALAAHRHSEHLLRNREFMHDRVVSIELREYRAVEPALG